MPQATTLELMHLMRMQAVASDMLPFTSTGFKGWSLMQSVQETFCVRLMSQRPADVVISHAPPMLVKSCKGHLHCKRCIDENPASVHSDQIR